MAYYKHFGLEYDGFDEVFNKFEALGGSITGLTEECLEFIPDMINPNLHRDMQKHHRSGQTEKTINEDNKVYWHGTVAYVHVGFSVHEGGLASIFLMYGTARHAPANQYGKAKGINKGMEADKRLYYDIHDSMVRQNIKKKQKEICDRKIQEIMGK